MHVYPASPRILALPGSLRRHSFNRRLCQAAMECAPAHAAIELADDLSSIPLFNEDLEAATTDGPEPVQLLRQKIAETDGLLITTPEYNQSMPGVLKNIIDWLSRSETVLADMPVAVIGASSGPWGTRLAQKELRHVLHATGALVMPGPMLFVRDAEALFDDSGRLADLATREKLAVVLTEFAEWIRRTHPSTDTQAALAAAN